METTTGLIIVAMLSVGGCVFMGSFALYFAIKQKLMMSESVAQVAHTQGRALGIDTGFAPGEVRRPNPSVEEITSLKRRYQDMQKRGVMTEAEEKVFAGEFDEQIDRI